MKRFLIVLLALVLFAGCFSACGGKKPTDDPNAVTTEPKADDVPLPIANYTGKVFTILHRDDDTYKEGWIADENATGETIGKAVYTRNSAVEERYGVFLDFESGLIAVGDNTYDSQFISKIDQMVLGGENTYQLVAGYTYRLAVSSTQGNFLNWYTMPIVDLGEEWWDEEFLTYASYRGCSYIADGSLSLTGMKSSACMFFDMDALNRFIPDGTAQVFGEVRDGKWTIDRLIKYAEDCTPSIEGDPNAQTYGFSSNQNTAIDAFIYGFDMNITTYNEEGTPRIKSINASNPIVAAYEKMKKFIYSDSCFSMVYNEYEGDIFVGMLLERKSVFSTGTLKDATTLRMDSGEINYGILPYPKWTDEQENYLTYKTDSRTTFAIPKTVKEIGGEAELEFVGTITEALAYYSNLYVKDALYNVVLKYRDARDEDSSYCVDLILKGGRYDFANIYAFVWGDQQGPAHLFRQCLKNSNSSSIATWYNAEKDRYDRTLTGFLENFYTKE